MPRQPLPRELDLSEMKSIKLKELCMYLRTEKITFFVSTPWDFNTRYRYEIIVNKPSRPIRLEFPPFPFPSLRHVPVSTIIFDMETKERIDIPLETRVVVRIKGPKKGQIFQIDLCQGSVEVTDIRRVHVSTGISRRSILMMCYLDPYNIINPF